MRGRLASLRLVLRDRRYGVLPPEMGVVAPLFILALGAFSVVDLWVQGWATPAAVGLVGVTTVTWLLAPELSEREILFSVLALVPLLAIHVLGGQLGIATVEASGPQASLAFLPFGAAAAFVAEVRRSTAVASLVVIVGILLGRCLAAGDLTSFAPWFCGVGLGCFAGWALERYDITLRELEAAQESLSVGSRADERRRIARDIHDAVSQSLAVVLLHVGTARMSVHRDPQGAAAALARAEVLGRSGLIEVRKTLQGLRSGRHNLASDRPSLDDVPALVGRFREAGVDVEDFVRVDDRWRPTEVCGNAAYRIVQESLANAVTHGHGRVRVRVRSTARHIDLKVSNRIGGDEAVSIGGQGLNGMRERVSELGGSFVARPEPVADGGWDWVVAARLPRVLA